MTATITRALRFARTCVHAAKLLPTVRRAIPWYVQALCVLAALVKCLPLDMGADEALFTIAALLIAWRRPGLLKALYREAQAGKPAACHCPAHVKGHRPMPRHNMQTTRTTAPGSPEYPLARLLPGGLAPDRTLAVDATTQPSVRLDIINPASGEVKAYAIPREAWELLIAQHADPNPCGVPEADTSR